ncbi:MAG: lytic transglycosylase domain-containing protein [Syntrophobacteraceae bacterium]|nr:lytic transglycosylase domain-containing protein [Syntrophobacteraceae bacterium]
MRGWSRRDRLEAAIAVFFVFFLSGCTPLRTATPLRQPSREVREERSAQSMQPVAPGGLAEVPYLPAPARMDLCGEPVPLDREAVYERFDREFTLIVYNHAQVYLWLKRMQRYFPMIEERLRHYGLPDDLKYVAIAESDLLPNACSPKGAAGPWQFMAGTGAAYGLGQSRCVDNRFSFQRSTDSAFMLLKNLDDKYHSWALALAAYNSGDKRVNDAMRVAGSKDYYDLCLPLETQRYVLRIIAIKAVLRDPGKYGYNLPARYGYRPVQTDQVTVSLPGPVSIQTIARAANTTYSEIKRLNPVFRTDELAAGAYQINLPSGTRKAFERNFKSGEAGMLLAGNSASSQTAPSPAPGARESRVSVRHASPHRTASHSTKQKRRTAARKGRVEKKSSRGPSSRVAPHKGAQRTRHKAAAARAGRKKKATSHTVKGKAVHKKPKPRGAKKKGGKSLAKR